MRRGRALQREAKVEFNFKRQFEDYCSTMKKMLAGITRAIYPPTTMKKMLSGITRARYIRQQQ
jgi:hypothetical protein